MKKVLLILKLILLIILFGCIVSLPFNEFSFRINLNKNDYSTYTQVVEHAIVSDSMHIEEIDLSLISGNINIKQSTDQEIGITYETNHDLPLYYKVVNQKLIISSDQNGLDILHSSQDGDVTISIPNYLNLEYKINTVSSEVEVNVQAEEIDINIVSGDIHLTNQIEDVQVNSVSGNLYIKGFTNGEIELDSVSGNLYFQGDSFEIDFKNASNSYEKKEANGDVKIDFTSVSGQFN